MNSDVMTSHWTDRGEQGLRLGTPGNGQCHKFPTTSRREHRVAGQLLDPPAAGQAGRLTELPAELAQLTNLRHLSLTGNRLAELPAELAQLTDIHVQVRSVSGNRLTEREIGQLAALQDDLGPLGNRLVDRLLGSLVAQGQGPSLRRAYVDSLTDAEARYEAKLLLVGDPEAGKSSLIARLRGERFLPGRSATHGIELGWLQLQHPSEPTTITLRTWDFGGQELYQATQQLFMTPQAVYLLVWDARRGDAERVGAWLRRIRLLVGDDARVMIAATRADEHPAEAELDYPALLQHYGTVLAERLYEVDSRSGTGLESLLAALAAEAAKLPQMGEQVSRRWVAARDQLLAHREPQLSYQACKEICAKQGVGADQADALLGLLHLRGQLLHYANDPDLREVVVLQPDWLTRAISYVLEDLPTRQSGGVLAHARLREVWQVYPPSLHPYLLRLMEQFDVSYRLSDADQPSSLVGHLVPHQPPTLPWQLDDPPARGIRELAVRLALSDETPGLMAWLIVRHHRFTTGLHWRRGVFLALADGFASQGLLELAAEGRELALTVRAPEPSYFFFVLLDGVRQLLRERWPGLAYDLLVPCQHRYSGPDQRRCPGRFRRDVLVQLYQSGEPTLRCPECATVQDVARLLTAVAAVRGPEPGGTIELEARLVQALQGGMQQVLQAELAPIADLVGSIDARLDAGLTEIGQTAHFTRALLQRWTIRYETTSGTPRLFTLTPVTKEGLSKAAVWQDRYQLTVWCEHDDKPHPWPSACYQFTRPKDWLVTIAPYAIGVLRLLQLAAKVTRPVTLLADVDLKGINDDLEAMSSLLQQLPLPPQPRGPADPGQAVHPVQADGSELRALRALLTELDPRRTFNGMYVVATSSWDVRWVCQDHYPAYNPGPPSIPA